MKIKLPMILSISSIAIYLIAKILDTNNSKEETFNISKSVTLTTIQEIKQETTTQETILESTTKEIPKENIVKYSGYVEHIFFHPLIAYPERAFDGEKSSKGMFDYMATASEFKKLLKELYKNGYVLVDIDKVYGNITTDDGVKKYGRIDFDFPKDKKPIIISMDDVNYYEYMIKEGCNFKLVLDENNNIATYSVDLDGKEVLSYDTEVITILEDFINEHPDFAFEGARGAIGVTGFDGILGYRTQKDSINRTDEIVEAKRVVEKLKSLGWTFASHSYAHKHMGNLSFETIKADVDQWKEEVEPLVGATKVFLYPYGEYIRHTNENLNKLNYLVDEGGFLIHCGVSVIPHNAAYSNYAFEVRKNIDGLTLTNQKERVKHLFDADYVISMNDRR